ELAGRALLRGSRVLVPDRDRGQILPLDAYLTTQVRRGFVTPLEAADARRRVEATPMAHDAALVLHADEDDVSVTLFAGGKVPLGLPLTDASPRLIEVGNGPLATYAALNRIVSWLSHLGYDPVVVADAPGFVARRILFAVFDEAVRLAGEGVPIDRIDEVGTAVLPPAGPLAQLDRLGIPRAARTLKRLLPLVAAGAARFSAPPPGRPPPHLAS